MEMEKIYNNGQNLLTVEEFNGKYLVETYNKINEGSKEWEWTGFEKLFRNKADLEQWLANWEK